jgi:hypothetical protein
VRDEEDLEEELEADIEDEEIEDVESVLPPEEPADDDAPLGVEVEGEEDEEES